VASCYKKCFLVNAYPELDLRYFSNESARPLLVKAHYQINVYSVFGLLDFMSPLLCSCASMTQSFLTESACYTVNHEG
jgi:hypothetical protein